MADIQALRNRVAEALADKPSQQPVGFKASDKPREQGKAHDKAGITAGYKAKQKGNPNKSYSVSVIDKARARLG